MPTPSNKVPTNMAAKVVKVGGKVFTEPAAKDGWIASLTWTDTVGTVSIWIRIKCRRIN